MRTATNLIDPVSETTTGGAVYDRFHAEPDTLAIAVVDAQNRPVGMVERHAFFLNMAAEYGRAVFGNRPITKLMNPAPMIVEADTPLSGFLASTIETDPSHLLRGFIVVDQGRYLGIGTTLGLLVAASQENRSRAAEMQAMAKSFRLLFDDNPVAMHLFDRRTLRILRVNDAAVAQFGAPRHALVGTPITEFIAVEHRSQALAGFRRGHDQGDTVAYPFVDGHGRERLVQSFLRPMTIDGARAILAATLDVSEREQAAQAAAAAREAAEASNRAKSEFLANMSHEIRTPLNGVIGISGSLARTRLSAKQSKMVRLISESADGLQVLLSDILDLARIEEGRLGLNPEPVQLGALLRQVGELFRAKAEEKGLRLTIDPCAHGALWVQGDPTRLKQILGNLLSNAVKFTQAGDVRLSLDARPVGGGHALTLTVTDTGIGFDEATRQRLFARFEQADGSVQRRFGGAGLGLSISRKLAEAMGGTLEANSILGAGSAFTLAVTLPAAAAVAAEMEDHDAEFDRPLRILLADDHPVNRTVVQLMFEGADVEFACAENGAIALDLFKTSAFDLVLMDMQMPVMDGLEATRSIRALERSTGRPATPVIMLSANALPEHFAAGKAAGADIYLAKPIVARDLFAAVEASLAQAAVRAAA